MALEEIIIKIKQNDPSITKLDFGPMRGVIYAGPNQGAMMRQQMMWKGLGDTNTIALAEALEVNTTVLELALPSNGITDIGAEALAKMLKKKVLRELDLSGNKIGVEGMQQIGESLRANSILVKLNVANNKIAINEAGIWLRALANIAQELNLSNNNIGDAGAEVIAEMLMGKVLRQLNLSGSDLGDSGMQKIGECLKTNTTLLDLNLSYIKFDTEGVRAIAEMLGKNKGLKRLDLSFSTISATDMEKIIEGLEKNATLLDLNLTGYSHVTKVDVTHAKKLGESLGKNTALKCLNLTAAFIVKDSLDSLLDGLEENKTITKLHGPSLGSRDQKKRIENWLDGNKVRENHQKRFMNFWIDAATETTSSKREPIKNVGFTFR